MYDVGTRISVMNVAKSTPKPSDTAIGTMNARVQAPVPHQRPEAEEAGRMRANPSPDS